MFDMIIRALAECGVSEYRINENRVETAELFFVRKNLDMRRINESVNRTVTVFRSFESDGAACKGFSAAIVHPGMTEKELRTAIANAYGSAQYVRNPAFEMAEGIKA